MKSIRGLILHLCLVALYTLAIGTSSSLQASDDLDICITRALQKSAAVAGLTEQQAVVAIERARAMLPSTKPLGKGKRVLPSVVFANTRDLEYQAARQRIRSPDPHLHSIIDPEVETSSLQVLEEILQNGEPIPGFLLRDLDYTFVAAGWRPKIDLDRIPHFGTSMRPAQVLPVPVQTFNHVERIVEPGGQIHYFKAFDQTPHPDPMIKRNGADSARKNHGCYLFSRAAGLSTIHPNEYVRVKGRLGLASVEIKGRQLSEVQGPWGPPSTYANLENIVDEESLSDANTLAMVLGDLDTKLDNLFLVDLPGKARPGIVMFDLGHALAPRIPKVLKNYLLGSQYSPKFRRETIDFYRTLSLEKLRAYSSNHFLPVEVEPMFFRIRALLRHIDIRIARGESVYFN